MQGAVEKDKDREGVQGNWEGREGCKRQLGEKGRVHG